MMDIDKEFDELFGRGNGDGKGTKKQQQQEQQLQEQIPFEQWLTALNEKYQNLKELCDYYLPGLWASMKFELSVQKILNIKDCTLPFAGILLGPPSSLKTVGIESFRKTKNVTYSDNFSARAFVSHSTTVKKDELAKIDLLLE